VWSDLIQIGARLQKIGTKSQGTPLKSPIFSRRPACGFNVVPHRSTWDFIVASKGREVIAVVDDDRREALDRLLSSWCGECGDELKLTPSGHYFCANRRCKDGFDVTPKRKLKKLLNLNSQLKDKRH
jgi:ribosomal protein L32